MKMAAKPPVSMYLLDYSSIGASTGHTSAHAPHDIQRSASITYILGPAEIASVGHSGSHAPQLMQSSVILYGISHLR